MLQPDVVSKKEPRWGYELFPRPTLITDAHRWTLYRTIHSHLNLRLEKYYCTVVVEGERKSERGGEGIVKGI